MTQELIERPTTVVDRGYLTSQDVMARMTRILEIQRAVMKERVHFGTIPGTPKPTLYKAGAEKLLATFQIAAVPGTIEDLSTADEIRYRVRMQGVNQAANVVLGEAIGECSSNEEKYRWRKPVCDEEFNEAPADQRREVWKKYQGKAYKAKQVRTSPADVANTILQMASKRALIPMTRVVLACSDIFDQDLEDMPEELRESILGGDGEHHEAPPPVVPPQRKSEQRQSAESQGDPIPAPPGACRVTSVTPRNGETGGRKWVLYIVKFSDGREGGTLEESIANVAIDARDKQLWVVPTLEQGKKPGTFQLVEMSLAQS